MCEEVITTAGPNRVDRLCLCGFCGETSRCTMSNDFYQLETAHPLYDPARDIGPTARLACERCFWEGARAAPPASPVGAA